MVDFILAEVAPSVFTLPTFQVQQSIVRELELVAPNPAKIEAWFVKLRLEDWLLCDLPTSVAVLDEMIRGGLLIRLDNGLIAVPGADANSKPSILDTKISVFAAPITNLTKHKDYTLRQVYELIQSEHFKARTEELRSINDSKANRTFKATKFAYATFSGTFPERYDSKLLEHSRLICIDLDHLGEDLKRVRETVNADPLTIMSFVSPNGDGLKVVFEINPSQHSQETYYKAISHYLTDLCDLPAKSIDSSCKNVSRACFLPHDENVYLNPNV